MWYSSMNQWGGWGFSNHWWGWMMPLVILDLILKGFALWQSARKEQKGWFIALLLINSLGILPAIYLLIHSSEKSKKKKLR